MKRVVIFTNKYPYEPPIEQFLHNEIEFFLNKYEVIIVPLARRIDKSASYSFDKRIKIIMPRRRAKIIEVLLGFFCLILHFGFLRKDMKFKKKRINAKTLIYTAKEYVKAFSLELSLKKIYRELRKDNQQKMILYSYWFGLSLVAINLLKRKNKTNDDIVISRAHGMGDLYVGTENDSFLFGGSLISQYTNNIFTISEDGKNFLNEYGLKKVSVSRLGIKRITSHHDLLTATVQRKIIVSCSTVNRNKRVRDIASIINLLDDEKIEWHHFGDGEDLDYIKAKCDISKSKSRIFFEGKKNNGDILQFYKKNNPILFINLSLVEGIPVSIMEAMACGIPCLATNVGAVKEIVFDKKNGYLVDRDYDLSLILKIVKRHLYLEKNEMDLLRECAYFTWERHYNSIDNYIDFINAIDDLDNS